jgi:hypothetical protein
MAGSGTVAVLAGIESETKTLGERGRKGKRDWWV